jgi:hypothetical protein
LALVTEDSDPLKNTTSPTCGSVGENTKSADPAGSVPVTVTWRVVVAVNPASLVTRSVTANVPARVNRCVVDVPMPVLPSPKSQL